ncbi:hypothetical protein DWU98_04645 [Dyella monticola]|uniref:Uncharacterized protein n=1 Tax=Dyella monticola TaxID=1927958 RepID=A0A370X5C6_9GAMM|nr:hypothetical protein [Dyella monticola]RDS83624.1 hypothetical protein DWU98_04645 [Dyella monticola]
MDTLRTPTSSPIALTATRFACDALRAWFRPKTGVMIVLMGISATALCATHPASPLFGGILHARGPHGVYTEIRFEPHRLIARVHEPHMCVLHAHLVHGDPHTSRYAIEPPQGGRFCDELVDGEILIHPHTPNDVIAEFRSVRMDWSGRFRRQTQAH